MKIRLVTHELEPGWTLPIKTPVGAIFEVIGYEDCLVMVDSLNNRKKAVRVYHIDTDEGVQIVPCDIFEIVKES